MIFDLGNIYYVKNKFLKFFFKQYKVFFKGKIMSLSSDAFEDQDIFIADILSKNKIIAMVGASKNWKTTF